MSRFSALVLVSLATLAALCLAVRFTIIEPREAALACASPSDPWWCAAREPLVWLFAHRVPGFVSVGAGLRAVLGGGRASVLAATLAGAVGLALYNAELGAVGLALGLLRASRL